MSIERVSGAGAACAFLLAAAYEMLTRRGLSLTLAGPIFYMTSAWQRNGKAED
jgi:hypothetical protein